MLSLINISYNAFVVNLGDEAKSKGLGSLGRDIEIKPIWLTASEEETEAALLSWLPRQDGA